MLGKFRGLIIIWIIVLGLLIVNFTTSQSIAGELAFVIFNIVTLSIALTISARKLAGV